MGRPANAMMPVSNTDAEAPGDDIAEPYIGPVAPTVDLVNSLIDSYYAEHGRVLELEATLAELRTRLTELEPIAAQTSSSLQREWGLQSKLAKLEQKHAAHRRQYPDPRWVKLEDINHLIDEQFPKDQQFPKRPISRQALNNWCDLDEKKSKVRAQKPKGRWQVELQSFRAHWELQGLPPLPWHKLRQAPRSHGFDDDY